MSSKVFKTMIVILAVVAIAGMGAVIIYLLNQDDPNRELTIDEKVEYSFTTEQINLDLQDGHYVQLQFNIITNNSKARDEVELREFQFKNILIKEFIEMTSEDLQTGLDKLEETLKSDMNELMEEGEVTDVYIVSKIVQ
ncbi:flagellar basal body-associated FliL family protein [Amphibacillus sediminis]|uniref:flagellar basal body-associated FliL family protein n=1 Tax=Amphibacillus sediminis TaxID=360185 RepID=UPI000835F877|nr:flagellar basal body-associated FliL family protein [Amphibacillus sediminis]